MKVTQNTNALKSHSFYSGDVKFSRMPFLDAFFNQSQSTKQRFNKTSGLLGIMSKEDKILENPTKIRELLTPKPAPPPPKGIWKELIESISK